MRLTFRLAALAIAFALTGCAHWPPWGPIDDSCAASTISHGGDWEVDGLRFPKDPKDAFSIGKVKYTQAQAQKLSDEANALENLRLAHCVDARSVDKLMDQGKVEAKDFFAWSSNFTKDWNATRVRLKWGLEHASTPEEGLRTADETTQKMLKAKEESDKAKAAIVGQVAPDTPAPWAKEMAALTSTVSALDVRVRKIESSPPPTFPVLERPRVGVSGFDPYGVGLGATDREQLAASVREVLASTPHGFRWIADVVGYADASGNRMRNLELGLTRAQVAAEVLRVLVPEVEIGSVASGGVAGPRDGDRKVDIFLSLTSVPLPG